jgi:hypothetical protein
MTSKVFMPTFLYIKQHNITGKLYFGKTTKNPEKYLGSGLHWVRHINKHGKEHVVNLWYCLFLDKTECVALAINFSKQNSIIESNDWLNLIAENGLDGGGDGSHFRGKSQSAQHVKSRISNMQDTKRRNPKPGWSRGMKGVIKQSKETCKRKSEYMLRNNPFRGKHHSIEQKRRWREQKLGKVGKNKNYVGITNGARQKFIPIDSIIPDGWYIGGVAKSESMKNKLKCNTNAKTKSVTINNITYPSKVAALKSLGLKSMYFLEKLL